MCPPRRFDLYLSLAALWGSLSTPCRVCFRCVFSWPFRTKRESIKRGMIRYVYLAIDLSSTMSGGDMRPSRLAVTLRIVQDFITNYFDQNPLSQLGILITR